jgi:hypothetical protein
VSDDELIIHVPDAEPVPLLTIPPKRTVELILGPLEASTEPLTPAEAEWWAREVASIPTGIVGRRNPFFVRHHELCGVDCSHPDAILTLRPLKDDELVIVSRAISSIWHNSRTRRLTARVTIAEPKPTVDELILKSIFDNPAVSVRALKDLVHVGHGRIARIAHAAGWEHRGNTKKARWYRRDEK